MTLEILDPGFITTVQDLGRFGFQKYGVGVGGAVDTLALRAANALVGNSKDEAVLEITIAGPRLLANEKCVVAITGARFALRVNDQPVPMNTALFLRAGATLEFGARESGARAYLAIAGGVDVPLVLGSRSTDLRGGFGGYLGRALRTGDVIVSRSGAVRPERAGTALPDLFNDYYSGHAPVQVIWGPHDEYFGEASRGAIESSEYEVSELSDRMALRLSGESIPRMGKELLSCGVTLGAMQVPLDGQPIILMADHQTTGGYPVLAAVIHADIPRLAQKIAGDKVSFRAVTMDEALRAGQEIEALINALR